MSKIRKLAAATACLAAMTPGAAFAADGDDVIRDCVEDGRVDGSYTQDDYRDAQRNMPADVDEYTDCRDQIRRAQLRAARAQTNGRGTATDGDKALGLPPTTDEQPPTRSEGRDADRASVTGGATRLRMPDGETILAGERGRIAKAGVSEMPAPLIALLIALGLVAAVTAASALRARGADRS